MELGCAGHSSGEGAFGVEWLRAWETGASCGAGVKEGVRGLRHAEREEEAGTAGAGWDPGKSSRMRLQPD